MGKKTPTRPPKREVTLDLIHSFCDRDSATGCLIWQRARSGRGYGMIWVNGAMRCATRVTWELIHGPIPSGQFVCHRCDNPPCVNPDHLFLGANADNVQDMLRKGRFVSRLDPSAIREIRRLAALGENYGQIARKFCIHLSTVGRIVKHQRWMHVDDRGAALAKMEGR